MVISDATGGLLLGVNFTTFDAIPTSYSIDPTTGELTFLHSIDIGNCANVGGAVVTSDDRLYLTCFLGAVSGVYGITFDGGGNLTPINGSPFPAGTGPGAIVLDASEKHLYVNDQEKNLIYGLDIGSDATLSAMSNSPFASGLGPQSLAVAGNHLYSANNFDNTISGYTIAPSTGALAALAESPFATLPFPTVVAADPSGAFLAIGNFPQARHARSKIETVAIDPSTGALSEPIKGSTHSVNLLRTILFASLP